MYMRLLSFRLKPSLLEQHRVFYEREVLPALENARGCMYATLLHPPAHSGKCISLTLWESLADLRSYEHDTFDELLRQSQQYLAEPTEWRLELTEDLTLEPVQVPNTAPTPRCYALQTASQEDGMRSAASEATYLRLARASVTPGSLETVQRIYEREIAPILRSVKGCRYACLLSSVDTRDELLSLTMWESEEAVRNYEQSAVPRELIRHIEPMMPTVYQWKVALEESHGLKAVTTGDLKTNSYSAVASKRFI